MSEAGGSRLPISAVLSGQRFKNRVAIVNVENLESRLVLRCAVIVKRQRRLMPPPEPQPMRFELDGQVLAVDVSGDAHVPAECAGGDNQGADPEVEGAAAATDCLGEVTGAMVTLHHLRMAPDCTPVATARCADGSGLKLRGGGALLAATGGEDQNGGQ